MGSSEIGTTVSKMKVVTPDVAERTAQSVRRSDETKSTVQSMPDVAECTEVRWDQKYRAKHRQARRVHRKTTEGRRLSPLAESAHQPPQRERGGNEEEGIGKGVDERRGK